MISCSPSPPTYSNIHEGMSSNLVSGIKILTRALSEGSHFQVISSHETYHIRFYMSPPIFFFFFWFTKLYQYHLEKPSVYTASLGAWRNHLAISFLVSSARKTHRILETQTVLNFRSLKLWEDSTLSPLVWNQFQWKRKREESPTSTWFAKLLPAALRILLLSGEGLGKNYFCDMYFPLILLSYIWIVSFKT